MKDKPILFERKIIACPEDYSPLSEGCEVIGARLVDSKIVCKRQLRHRDDGAGGEVGGCWRRYSFGQYKRFAN